MTKDGDAERVTDGLGLDGARVLLSRAGGIGDYEDVVRPEGGATFGPCVLELRDEVVLVGDS